MLIVLVLQEVRSIRVSTSTITSSDKIRFSSTKCPNRRNSDAIGMYPVEGRVIRPQWFLPAFEMSLLEDKNLDPKEVGDIITESVLQRGDERVAKLRVGGMLGGLPAEFQVKIVNRMRYPDLQVIQDGAAAIEAVY